MKKSIILVSILLLAFCATGVWAGAKAEETTTTGGAKPATWIADRAIKGRIFLENDGESLPEDQINNPVAQKIKEMTGSASEIEYISYDKAYGPGFEDMERRCPNISKIKKLIGFKPKHDLDAIIQSVIDYFKE